MILFSSTVLFCQLQNTDVGPAGSVISLASGAPIRKASVRITGASVDVIRETDAQGLFSLTGFPAGYYDISVKKTGYVVDSDGIRRASVKGLPLEAGASGIRVELKLTPMSIISGHVLDEDGDPVAGIGVEVLKAGRKDGKRHWIEQGSVKTDDRGAYRVPMLQPGRYVVRTEARNREASEVRLDGATYDSVYPATYYGGGFDELAATPVELHMGEEAGASNIRIIPVKAFRIRGRVNRPKGTGVILAVARNGGMRQIVRNLSPTESSFELSGMTPAEYTLYAEADEDSQVSGIAQGSVQIADRDENGVILSFESASDIHGSIRVLDAATPPDLRTMTVGLHGREAIFFPANPSAVTADLTFTLPNVVPARFGVEVKGVPDDCYVKSILYNGVEIAEAEDNLLRGGKLEIVLSGLAAQIDGTVMSQDSAPLPRGTVLLMPADSRLAPRWITADQDAKFHFGGLKPGKYSLLAASAEPAALMDLNDSGKLASEKEKLALEPGDHRGMQITAAAIKSGVE